MTIQGKTVLSGAALALVLALPRPTAACSVTAGDFDGNGTTDLRILGDARPQRLILAVGGGVTVARLDCNGDGDFSDPGEEQSFASEIETVDVQLQGRDRIEIEVAEDTGHPHSVLLNLGPGGNTVVLVLGGADRDVDVAIAGGSGADDLVVQIAPVSAARVSLRAELGSGDDSVTLSAQDLTDASLDLALDLGPGHNTLVWAAVPQAGAIALTRSRLSLDVEGGDAAANTDHVDLTPGRRGGFLLVGSRLVFDVRLRAGNDDVAVTIPSDSNVDARSEARFSLAGGAGADRLGLQLQPVSSGSGVGSDGRFEVSLEGGSANDLLTLDGEDLSGNGLFRLFAHGGDGNDTVFASVAELSTAANVLDLRARGGRGLDTVYTGLVADAPGVSFAPGGAALLDGGFDGPDTCLAFGGPISRLGCELGF
jgi:hypothetical protein